MQDRRGLCTGDMRIRCEDVRFHAGHDAALRGPGDRRVVIAAARHVGRGRAGQHFGRIAQLHREAVENGGKLAAREVRARGENIWLCSGDNAVCSGSGNRIGAIALRVYVRKVSRRGGGHLCQTAEDGDDHGTGQRCVGREAIGALVSAKVQWRFSPPAEYSMREKCTWNRSARWSPSFSAMRSRMAA